MKKRITDDFFKEYVNTTHMKPNGSGLFSFVRYDTDMENDRYISDLYLFDMDAGRSKKDLHMTAAQAPTNGLMQKTLSYWGPGTRPTKI